MNKRNKLLLILASITIGYVMTLIISSALAVNPYAMLLTQRNGADISNITNTLLRPAAGTNPIIGYDSTNDISHYVYLGTGLSYSSNTISVNSLPIANVSGLQAALDSKGTSSFSGAFSALTGIPTTLSGYGITDAYPLSGNPSGFLTSSSSLAWAKITGAPAFITGISGSDVTTALGYTPYNATNPSAYITSSALSGYQLTSGLGTAAFQLSTAFATSAQGALAASAVQPGANISALTNDAGYITSAPVSSVAGKTGAVTLVKGDVGLSNVDNTSDANKPVSTAQAASIATKLTIPAGTTSQYVDGTGALQTTPIGAKSYEGTTLRIGTFPIFKSVAVSSGTATFNLTADGLSTGTTLCTNGVIQDSVQAVVNDSGALYPMSWAWSNSNKTLIVTTNKASATGVIALLGLNLLGAPVAAANGSIVKLTVWCY